MNGTPFNLATLRKPNGAAFIAIVLGENAIDLETAHAAHGKGHLTASDTMIGLLENWDANFAVLQEIVAFIEKNGLPAGSAKLANVHALPPVLKPGKMFYAAQNFQEHVNEMLRAGMTPAGGPQFTGEKSSSKPYLFLKASSTLAGAFR